MAGANDESVTESMNEYVDADLDQQTLPDADVGGGIAYGPPASSLSDWDTPDLILADLTGAAHASLSHHTATVVETAPDFTCVTSHAPVGTEMWVVIPAAQYPVVDRALTADSWTTTTTLTWLRPAAEDHQSMHTPEPTVDSVLAVHYLKTPSFPGYTIPVTPSTWVRREWGSAGFKPGDAPKCDTEFPVDAYLTGDAAGPPPHSVVTRLRDHADDWTCERPGFRLPHHVDFTADWWQSVTASFTVDSEITTTWRDTAVPRTDVHDIVAPEPSVPHPTTVETWAELIARSSEVDDTVWIPYAGAGRSTAAVKQLGRRPYGAVSNSNVYKIATRRIDNVIAGERTIDSQVGFDEFQ